MIRLIKDLLRKKLGRAALAFDELSTILCEVEALVNSRPLTYIDNEEQLIPLTPACFLQDLQEVGVADLDQVDRDALQHKFKYRLKLIKELRQRFRDEYLSQLKLNRNKDGKVTSLKVGDLVLVSDDNKKRLLWPLARIIELYSGRDGNVRCVKLNTTKGTLMRPIQRLIPLEIPDDSAIVVPTEIPGMGGTSDTESTVEKATGNGVTKQKDDSVSAGSQQGFYTRRGHWVKVPQRLDLLNQVVYRFETSS